MWTHLQLFPNVSRVRGRFSFERLPIMCNDPCIMILKLVKLIGFYCLLLKKKKSKPYLTAEKYFNLQICFISYQHAVNENEYLLYVASHIVQLFTNSYSSWSINAKRYCDMWKYLISFIFRFCPCSFFYRTRYWTPANVWSLTGRGGESVYH